MPFSRSRNPFAVRDFRLLWIGEAVSTVGDQFVFIALPWLALVLTGSGLALGGVLALMAIPRAVFLVIGGVSVDRFSPRVVMLASNGVRLVAVTVLGLLVLLGIHELWMLYAFALVFGVADAFFFPAQTSIVPELIDQELLQRANGIVQGTAQGAALVGPAVAGITIAALGSEGADTTGIAAALLLDALTFVVSMVTLWHIKPRHRPGAPPASIVESIREGMAFVWGKASLRAIILVSLSANLFIVGPFEVGLPYFAYTRLPEGVAAFGVLLAAFGGGSLVGLTLGALLAPPPPERLGPIVMAMLATAGLGLAGLAFVHSTFVAGLFAALSGMALGYGNLLGLTWAQSRIPADLMGRVMSLMFLGSIGLVPVSMLLAGATVQVSLEGTLLIAGAGMALMSLGALLSPTVRDLGLEPPLTDRVTTGSDSRPAGMAAVASGSMPPSA